MVENAFVGKVFEGMRYSSLCCSGEGRVAEGTISILLSVFVCHSVFAFAFVSLSG
jgi:hypothetical protein